MCVRSRSAARGADVRTLRLPLPCGRPLARSARRKHRLLPLPDSSLVAVALRPARKHGLRCASAQSRRVALFGYLTLGFSCPDALIRYLRSFCACYCVLFCCVLCSIAHKQKNIVRLLTSLHLRDARTRSACAVLLQQRSSRNWFSLLSEAELGMWAPCANFVWSPLLFSPLLASLLSAQLS